MATFTRTYTFTVGTKAKGTQVNTSFDEIATFLNNSVVHVDGSKAFTGIPSIATGIDPSSANHLSRKAYVDAGDLLRLKVANVGSTVVGGAPTVASTQFQVQSGTYSGTTNSSATLDTAITFPTAFANGLVSVTVTPILSSDTTFHSVRLTTQTKTAFNVDAWSLSGFGTYSLVPAASKAIKFNWVAVGW